jgi:hypothetical protein
VFAFCLGIKYKKKREREINIAERADLRSHKLNKNEKKEAIFVFVFWGRKFPVLFSEKFKLRVFFSAVE